MDTTAIIVIALFALIVIGFLLVFRRRGKAEVKGPFNLGLNVEGSNDPPPPIVGVNIEGAKSRAGGLNAEDTAGGHVNVRDVEVQNDINVSRGASSEDTNPKAPPPA